MRLESKIAIGIGVFLLGSGAIIFYLTYFKSLIPSIESQSWPSVQGIVVDLGIDNQTSIERDSVSERLIKKTFQSPRVAYEYTVDEVQYIGDSVWLGMRYAGSDAYNMDQMMSRYNEGKQVRVFYNPKRPGIAVLEPGSQQFHYYMLLVSAVLLFFGSLMLATGIGHPIGKILLFIFAALFLVVGGYHLTSFSIPDLQWGISSRSWPTTEGTIITHYSRTYSARLLIDENSYRHENIIMPEYIEYAYRVNEKEFLGTKRWYGDMHPHDKNMDLRVLGNYTDTGMVKVFYDPDHPEKAVLMPGTMLVRSISLWSGVVWLMIGLIILLAAFGLKAPQG